VAVGLSISVLAVLPRTALERARVSNAVIEQRPHVFMSGVTIACLTGFAYLLAHWSP